MVDSTNVPCRYVHKTCFWENHKDKGTVYHSVETTSVLSAPSLTMCYWQNREDSYDVNRPLPSVKLLAMNSRQRNSGYRPSRINIMAQGLSTLDPSLSPTHLSIRRGCATTTHYTHHQVSLVVSRNATLVPSLGLHIGPACEAGLSAGMRRQCVSPQIRKKERKKTKNKYNTAIK